MMNKVRYLVFILMLSVVLFSCSSDEEEQKETTPNKAVVEQQDETMIPESKQADSLLFIGKWIREDKAMSLQFIDQQKCIATKNDKVSNEIDWKINTEKKELIIYFENGAKMFEYNIKENLLSLKMQGKNKVIGFERQIVENE
jgi:predicted phosphodiesterase